VSEHVLDELIGKTIESAVLFVAPDALSGGLNDEITLRFTDGSKLIVEGEWHNNNTGGVYVRLDNVELPSR